MIGQYILLVLVLLAAVAAVESRNLLFSVSAFAVAGLGFCLTYLWLGAWDLALVQLAAEIALLFYLIRSTQVISEPETYPGRQLTAYLCTFVFAVIFAGFAWIVLQSLPAAAPATGGNRPPGAYELIGIAAALFAAVVGWLTVARPEGKR